MRSFTSRAVASPVFTMKFACSSDTWAPPIRMPLSPARSTSDPADSPGGLRNTLPHVGSVSGCVFFRRASDASILPRIKNGSAGSTESSHSTMTSSGANELVR